MHNLTVCVPPSCRNTSTNGTHYWNGTTDINGTDFFNGTHGDVNHRISGGNSSIYLIAGIIGGFVLVSLLILLFRLGKHDCGPEKSCEYCARQAEHVCDQGWDAEGVKIAERWVEAERASRARRMADDNQVDESINLPDWMKAS